MKGEFFFSKIDRKFVLETFSQKHKELILKYQILTTAIFSFSIAFAIAYATGQIPSTNAFNMIFYSVIYGFVGYFALTIIFEDYFKSLREELLDKGSEYA